MKKIKLVLVGLVFLFGCQGNKLDVINIKDYVGLNIESKEVQLLLKELGGCEISNFEATEYVLNIKDKDSLIREEGSTYYVYKEKGIEIVLNDSGIIDRIFIYSGNDKYKQYQKELPFNLEFTNTRKMLIDKFGKPDNTFAGNKMVNVRCVDNWNKSKGISIEYNGCDSTNMYATIFSICLNYKK